MISVCMATFNGERFIKEQIDSILCQLSSEDELIISDDGSTDKTLDIITSYNDNRIKLLHHKKKPEYTKIKYSRNFYYATDNFENALQHAQGEYIFLSDQDDVWMKNKVEISMAELGNNVLVMSNFNIINSSNETIVSQHYVKSPIGKSSIGNLLRSKYLGCCMAFRKEILDVALPFPDGLLAHDLWLGLIGNRLGNFKFIPEPLIQYRRTGTNVSPSTEGSKNSLFFKIFYRVRIFFQFIYQLKIKNSFSSR